MPDGHWILDTGSPQSFGDQRSINLADKIFEVSPSFMGLNAKSLSDLSGISVQGLIGTDILNEFDIFFDVKSGQVTFGSVQSESIGKSFPIDFVMGVPKTTIQIQGREVAMVFDTGATFSYWQDLALDSFPEKEIRLDYFPGIGEFEVKTYHVPITLGDLSFQLEYGRLPEMLGMTLSLIGADGIWADAYDLLYQKSFGLFYDELTQLTINSIQELTPSNSRIVDFGAGTGRIALPLARTGRHVTAVEPCAEMLHVLHRKQGDTVLEVVNCCMADFTSSRFYDFGTCVFTVLLYLLDEVELEASLKAAAQVLRPGAKFMIDIPSRALFSQSHRKDEDFDRFVDIQPLGKDLYRYDENSMLIDAGGHERHLIDSFTIRYWHSSKVLSIADRCGLIFDKDLSGEFSGTGSEYFLLKKS